MNASFTFSERVLRCVDHIVVHGPDAIAGLVDLSSVRLVRFATAVTRNQHDAEDAVQTVMVRIAQRPQLVLQAAQPWAYLLQMVRNESLAMLRRRQRTASWSDDLGDLLLVYGVDQLEQRETIRAVWQGLRQLPPQQCEVIVLKIWENLTFAEMAEVLELPAGTVASRYRYGMEKLADHLRGCIGQEVPGHG